MKKVCKKNWILTQHEGAKEKVDRNCYGGPKESENSKLEGKSKDKIESGEELYG